MRALLLAGVMISVAASYAEAAPINLVTNGSFEGPTGVAPTGWAVGGTARDGYFPTAIAYNQNGSYPYGAQGEAVRPDDAASASPDGPGLNGVYFVSDTATNLSLYQNVYLTPGSYDIGFDSYDTFNGSVQPHESVLTANIAGVQLASFALSTVSPGSWSTHMGEARIQTAGYYLVSFAFTNPDYPNNPGSDGLYNAKDVVIDQAYVIGASDNGGTPIPAVPVPEPASLALLGMGVAGIAAVRRKRAG